ncbi:MAG: nitrilase-related carbon-nitrogen hydrolase [Anaerolineae bacterium]
MSVTVVRFNPGETSILVNMRRCWPMFTAAAVPAGPVCLNRDVTVDKACALIRQAGGAGARLVALPEVFVPGFPHWIYLDRPQANWSGRVVLGHSLPG